MEEASVAGESPDRSKQRESSAEPTSGSASPVPEARSSARDPRLAVARESISLGGVDTATRVFSVRDLPKTPEKPDESPAEAGTGGSDTGEPDDAPSAAETRPEGAGGAEGPEEDREDDSATAESSGDADTDDSGTAESAGDSDAAKDRDDTDATDEPDDSGTAESPGDSTPGGNPADADTTDEPVDSATAESSGDSDAPDARLRDAVAAWVRTGDEKTGPEGKGTEPADDASEDESAPDTESKTRADTDAATETDAAETAVADDEDHVPDTAGLDSPDDPDEESRPDTDKSDFPGARGTARPAPADPQTDDEPDDDSETPEGGGSDGAGVSDKRPVDQPTAVFKAPRPPVDQPTTMLKLGKAADAADAKTAEPKDADAPRKPETPAERTSKFVALKALDEPRESRPKADVTAAVPQVGQVGPERTTQQPLPPKPPLDLLAELTNTPPPPPSPLRTLGRRVKIWTPILILLVVAFAIAQSLRPLPTPTLSLTAEDSYTFDGSKAPLPWPTQGQGWLDVNGVGTMGNFGKQTPVAIGSVAKAMTAYIVLKDHPLKSGEEGAKITVDALAEKEGGYNKQGESTLNTVKKGDVLTERQAIAAIMIPSANNIARLLARWDSGSEAAFIKKMNDTAEELGMKNTKYTDASGLKETTVSSAEDQVKLGNELVKIPALMEITSMGQWIDPSGQKWYNYNYLVPYTGIGIKTGTTTAAGGNLLFAGRKEVGGESVTVVGAILGQHKAPIIKTVNDVSKVALLAAEDALTSAKILKKGAVVGYVDDGLGGHTPVVLTKDVTAVGWAGFKVKLSFAADDVPHTAKAGTKVGSLTVGDGEGGAVKVPVTLQKDLTEPGFTDKLTRVG
ncbi:D-alanyl-D-alanine carboxypeptidase (penicillin-binding protein 5/6) [Streptomyces sp. SAI-144]|uniref:D-alanyl-D-alanine carboxypeptidase n=1 Tax=Streptomyces sp. SAI-144 TaxID=2940544 RepID=UPI002476BFF3|nr:D-alanyl-D-alanine carboxypeptidase [Streptomyces sp. SAI-144]MDH6435134.1 D-alanyl-D-alanine carboxypeptidase (penicillin-binding protein 5/6) [Streptomyces sp. SAI-144]